MTGPGVAYTAAEVARWAGGEVAQGAGDTRVGATSIDTRTLPRGAAFFAIRGPNHDAHDHLAAAQEAGAALFVTERGRSGAAHGATGRRQQLQRQLWGER